MTEEQASKTHIAGTSTIVAVSTCYVSLRWNICCWWISVVCGCWGAGAGACVHSPVFDSICWVQMLLVCVARWLPLQCRHKCYEMHICRMLAYLLFMWAIVSACINSVLNEISFPPKKMSILRIWAHLYFLTVLLMLLNRTVCYSSSFVSPSHCEVTY